MKLSKPKVIYIAAHSRSGSTIVDRVLGQVHGGFTVGELRNIWQRSFIENQLCGCHSKFTECDVWKEIVKGSAFDTKYAEKMHSISRKVDRFKKIPQIIFPKLSSALFKRDMSEYLEGLSKLYTGVNKIVEPEFIIDSSKSSSYAMHLRHIDLHIVHLVRDSRAVAYSRMRKKKRPEIHWKNEYMAVTPAYKTAF